MTDFQDVLRRLYGGGNRRDGLGTGEGQPHRSGRAWTNEAAPTTRQKEAANFDEVSAVLAGHGFDCVWLGNERDGVDFLAEHPASGETLRVQLTSCLAVGRKYENKGLWVAFPVEGDWYLLPHDQLRDIVGERTPALRNRSWLEDGRLWWGRPTRALLVGIGPYRIRS